MRSDHARIFLSFYQRARLYALPGMVLFILFWIYPFGITIYYSFVESAFQHDFVGLKNYAYVWNNQYYQLAVKNSIRFSLTAVPLCWILSLTVALCLERLMKYKQLLMGLLLIPMFIPSSATIEIWNMLFPGVESAFGSLLCVFLWKNTGFASLLLLISLSNIPRSSKEAAKLDGASFPRLLCQIILPQMTNQSFLTAMLLLSWSMRVFKESFSLYGAYPPEGIYMVQNYINNQYTKMRYPNMTVASIGSTLLVLIITVIWTHRENSKEG